MTSQDGAPPATGDDEVASQDGDGLKALLNAVIAEESEETGDSGVTEDMEVRAYVEAFKASEKQRHEHREILTPALRNIAQVWVIAVLFFIFWQGFGYKIGIFHLSDKVLITLLTTTTANILGLFYIAVRCLYANPDYKSPRSALAKKSGRAP